MALPNLSYVLPDPVGYRSWSEFQADLACMREAGYAGVELQIADPTQFDSTRVEKSLNEVGFRMCAFQTGTTYGTRGNCLSTADESVRERTIALLDSFVDLARQWKCTIVFGSLQGRLKDEPDQAVGESRIAAAMERVGRYASERGVTLAFEPVNHMEVGFHHTIGEVAALVRRLKLPGVKMMIDSFHMNIEERDVLGAIAPVADILAHVHLSETNRDILGTAHWPTGAMFRELTRIGYQGWCSVGVYNTRRPRHECIRACMDAIRKSVNT